MANPHKGEATLKAKDVEYVLRYSSNAIVELENALDRGFTDIALEMTTWAKNPKAMRVGTMRAVLWAGLRERHPDITLEQAGDLLLDGGGMFVIAQKVSEALTLAFPQAETKGARPPNRKARRTAKATTGLKS